MTRARLCLVCLLLAACGDDADEAADNARARPRGVLHGGEEPARPPTPRVPSTPNEPAWQPEPDPSLEPTVAAETMPAAEAAPEPTEKPARDLRRELESMMGSPASCLAPRPAREAPGRLTIALSASVMPSGAVSRGEVSAPQLSPEEIDCVRKRLEGLHFSPPIEAAPVTVQGTVTLERGS